MPYAMNECRAYRKETRARCLSDWGRRTNRRLRSAGREPASATTERGGFASERDRDRGKDRGRVRDRVRDEDRDNMVGADRCQRQDQGAVARGLPEAEVRPGRSLTRTA